METGDSSNVSPATDQRPVIALDGTTLISADSFLMARPGDPYAARSFRDFCNWLCNNVGRYLPTPREGHLAPSPLFELWIKRATEKPYPTDVTDYQQSLASVKHSFAVEITKRPRKFAKWIQFQLTPDRLKIYEGGGNNIVKVITHLEYIEPQLRNHPSEFSDALNKRIRNLAPEVSRQLSERVTGLDFALCYAFEFYAKGLNYARGLDRERILYKPYPLRQSAVTSGDWVKGTTPEKITEQFFPWGSIFINMLTPEHPLHGISVTELIAVLDEIRDYTSQPGNKWINTTPYPRPGAERDEFNTALAFFAWDGLRRSGVLKGMLFSQFLIAIGVSRFAMPENRTVRPCLVNVETGDNLRYRIRVLLHNRLSSTPSLDVSKAIARFPLRLPDSSPPLSNEQDSASSRNRLDTATNYAVPIVRKKATRHRSRTSSSQNEADPKFEMAEYEKTLGIISNMALVLERSPRHFKSMGEDTLRHHILVQLNGLYEGQATGETFNHQGKTDILIRWEGANIFIAECKFWSGEKAFLRTIDQLLRYVTWRDTKTAIILFNRNTDFSNVLQSIAGAGPLHPNYKRSIAYGGETGFRWVMSQPTDQNREWVLTVLAFDVPQ